jgi:hypothetical protein
LKQEVIVQGGEIDHEEVLSSAGKLIHHVIGIGHPFPGELFRWEQTIGIVLTCVGRSGRQTSCWSLVPRVPWVTGYDPKFWI